MSETEIPIFCPASFSESPARSRSSRNRLETEKAGSGINISSADAVAGFFVWSDARLLKECACCRSDPDLQRDRFRQHPLPQYAVSIQSDALATPT